MDALKQLAKASAERLRAVAQAPNERSARALVEAHLGPLREALFAAPFYAERLRTLGLSPRDLVDLHALEAFPLTSRLDFGRSMPEMIGRMNARLHEATRLRSSGTSGQPVEVLRDAYDRVFRFALLPFWFRQAKRVFPTAPRVLFLCTLPKIHEANAPIPLLSGTLQRISTHTRDAVDRIKAFAPHIISTDPEGLRWLLLHRPESLTPSLVMSSATRLPGSLRSSFESDCDAALIDVYATTESGALAWSCPLQPTRFHVLAPEVWLESVEGELCVTRLRPGAYALLRYQTGDRGRVEWCTCTCGLRGWTIEALEGRDACAFVRPDGTTADAWRLAWLLDELEDFRLVQHTPTRFVLESTPSSEAKNLAAEIVSALQLMGWPACRVECETGSTTHPGLKRSPFIALESRLV